MLRQVTSSAISLKPYLIVFTASACGLTIEIVASRLLAPMIGVSLYTWTSIIGVVLAGISIGNYLGGRAADRFPSQTTLGLILLGGGISSISVLPLLGLISGALPGIPYVARIVFLTATLFLLPSLILGMVTPVVIKLRLQDLAETGSVVGKIYGVATTGSIFGTFVTGFVLIQWVGTRSTVILVALVLVLMAFAFGNLLRAKVPGIASIALFLGLGAFSFSSGALDSDCTRESNYFCITVEEALVEGHIGKTLSLDDLVHSYVSLEDPTLLVYGYEKILADVSTYVARRNPNLQVLFIGGGGYTMPRFLEVLYPESALEVIEIDPEVTRVAFEYMGLWPDARIVTYNEDARVVVPRLAHDRYDLVIGDAFNDISVPFHLTTKEFNEQVRALLKDDGIYAVNIVDKLHTGRFLRAYVNTLQRTFPHVYIVRNDLLWEDDRQTTHVVVGSFRPLSSAALEDASFQSGRGEPVSNIMPEESFDSWLNTQESILLTDDYAPVDNLLASLHLQKTTAASQAATHFNTAVELHSEGRIVEAIVAYDRAIELDPALALAYHRRGTAYHELRQYEQAIPDFDVALRLDPQYTAAYYNRGISYRRLGQYQRAIQDFDQVLRLNPLYAPGYYNRGRAYDQLGDPHRAIQDYGDAIDLNPADAPPYQNRGAAYTKLGQFNQAMQDYDTAIRLDTGYVLAYRNRGSVHYALGEFERAIQDLDEAIRLDPQVPGAYTLRGIAYGSQGEFERAIQDLDEAIRLDPEEATSYDNRGSTYARLGEFQLAIRDFGHAIRLDPEYAPAYHKRGSAYENLGELQRAIQDLGESIRLSSQDPAAYADRAIVYTRLSMDAPAQRDVNQAVRLGFDRSFLEREIQEIKKQR